MRTRLRLGAVTVVALGALLMATALASPAFAWHSTVTVEAYCLESGEVQVDYTVSAFDEGYPADVAVFYKVNDGDKVDEPGGAFTETESEFDGSFVLPAGTTGWVTVVAKATWKDTTEKPSKNQGTAKLPKKCKDDTTTSSSIEDTTTSSSIEDTTSTSEEETTTSKEEEETTTSSAEEETTTSEVLGETSTTAGGQLPFTGASSGPMLLAGLGLVGGGLLFLWSSRTRNASR
jgi:hypothetical protein